MNKTLNMNRHIFLAMAVIAAITYNMLNKLIQINSARRVDLNIRLSIPSVKSSVGSYFFFFVK